MTTSALVRVSVASAARRVDLTLPASVPAAELMPELARSVGVLDAATVHEGYRLVAADGRILELDAALAVQGVSDGALLTVATAADDRSLVYDDLGEALADAVTGDCEPWRPASARFWTLATGFGALLLGAIGLLALPQPRLAGLVALAVSACCLAVAAALSRIRRDTRAAVAVSWASAAYAVLTGLLLASARPVADWSEVGAPVAAGGAGAILAGLLAMAALADGRVLAVAPAIAGAVVAGAVLPGEVLLGEVLSATGRAPAAALTAALVLVVLVGTALPTHALSAVLPASSRQLDPEPGTPTAPGEIDAAQVRADVLIAGEILLAGTAATGMLLVAVAPFAVSLGAAGASLAVLAALTVLLAARRRRAAAIARTGLVSGIAGLLASAAAILWLHPDWRPVAAVALPLGGLAVLGATLLPPAPSVRRSRLADLLESAALLALLPLLAVAAGLLDVIRGG